MIGSIGYLCWLQLVLWLWVSFGFSLIGEHVFEVVSVFVEGFSEFLVFVSRWFGFRHFVEVTFVGFEVDFHLLGELIFGESELDKGIIETFELMTNFKMTKQLI
jgi:hypothetical protein